MANVVDFNDADVRRVKRVLDRIEDDLEDPGELAHQYAQAILQKAVANAAGRPTPQAPMAAAAMRVDGDTIRPLTGGVSAAVGGGSEYGSDIYLQFQRPHTREGYWLFPAAESEEVEAAGDKMLNEILDKAVASG